MVGAGEFVGPRIPQGDVWGIVSVHASRYPPAPSGALEAHWRDGREVWMSREMRFRQGWSRDNEVVRQNMNFMSFYSAS